jgi:hypothetical protein
MAKSRDEARLEKSARESALHGNAKSEADAVRAKTARLKALRLAKEAAGKAAGAVPPSSAKKMRIRKKAVRARSSAKPLGQWLADEAKDGRRS